MMYTTLVTADELVQHLDDPNWAIVDCRTVLPDPPAGRLAYEAGHIPGAVYADLDYDLSAPPVAGQTGRHPLPTIETFSETLSQWGIDRDVQVVAYDALGGALSAARLWIMLRWLGHDAVAVLDGGWQVWQQADYEVRIGNETRAPRLFVPQPREDLFVTVDEVMALHTDPHRRLIDTRPADRFRGESEPIDAVAGHIPGAQSQPFLDNIGENGRLLSAEQLRARFTELLNGATAEQTTFYCGSGVSAAQGILAMEHAGLGLSRLYVGSWSDWSNDPSRPVERGA